MTNKKPYIAPASHIVRLALSGDITEQFPVNSQHTINEGDAKPGFFDNDDAPEETGNVRYNTWED